MEKRADKEEKEIKEEEDHKTKDNSESLQCVRHRAVYYSITILPPTNRDKTENLTISEHSKESLSQLSTSTKDKGT